MVLFDYVTFLPGKRRHDIVALADNICPREEWIQYMVEYYKKIWPSPCYTEENYRKWAVGAIDRALESLGDYFSRSSYVPGR